MTDRQAFWVSCRACGHVWVGCYVPMALGTFARILKAQRCPNCASRSTDHFASDPPAAGASPMGLLTRAGGA